MSRQYKRDYRLSITPTSGEVKVVKGLRISFEITKSVLGYPNIAKITLYNPSPETLATLQTKFTKISLEAGYEGNIRLLFTGQIKNILQSKIDVDRTAIIYAGDGEKDWQNSSFNKTFEANVSIQAAIKEVIASFKNLDVGALEGLPEGADKLLGQTLSGSSKDIMDMFASEYGFTWSIQNEEIQITPIEEPLQGTEAILITSSTGMIGSPVITEIGADVTTLLNPNLLPNTAFKIESVGADTQLGNLTFRTAPRTSAEGLYKIQETLFKGDSREGVWLSTVKGRSIR